MADELPAAESVKSAVESVMDDIEELKLRLQISALSALFDPCEIKFRPGATNKEKTKALALAYVDARCIQDRLDAVVGAENWHDEYTPLGDGSVMCRLTVKLGNKDITKSDVGTPSDAEPIKGAFSDALKRAAVKFGVGRYLYRLPNAWVGFDAGRKMLTEKPKLPDWALPVKKPAGPAGNRPQSIPATGDELDVRLRDYDAKVSGMGLCRPGEVYAHVMLEGQKAGYSPKMTEWSGPAIPFAVDVVRAFERRLQSQRVAGK